MTDNGGNNIANKTRKKLIDYFNWLVYLKDAFNAFLLQ